MPLLQYLHICKLKIVLTNYDIIYMYVLCQWHSHPQASTGTNFVLAMGVPSRAI